MDSAEVVVDTTVSPKKSLGQHWLSDQAILQSICISADVHLGDEVLEIGPGLGTLTSELLHFGAHVTALEFDHELAVGLLKTVTSTGNPDTEVRLKVLEGDIRGFDFSSMPPDYKVVANIPYYLTSNLMRSLCDTSNKPSVSAILMQKEVAERIVSSKSKSSLLSMIVQYSYECSLGSVVEKQYFTPPPKVDSQVLILKRRTDPVFEADRERLIRLLKAGFSEKRKNLRNALSGGLAITKERSQSLLDSAGLGYERRAESLSWEEWHELYCAYVAMT